LPLLLRLDKSSTSITGIYRVTKTIFIPPGSKIVGEAYSVIMSSATAFSNINFPQPVVQVGKSGQAGNVE
jgi:glucan 1,3-beta-glucosidase